MAVFVAKSPLFVTSRAMHGIVESELVEIEEAQFLALNIRTTSPEAFRNGQGTQQ
jgi:hypothetical protein